MTDMSELGKENSDQSASASEQEVWGVLKLHGDGQTFTTPYVWCDSKEFAEKALPRFNHAVVRRVARALPQAERENGGGPELQQMSLFSQD